MRRAAFLGTLGAAAAFAALGRRSPAASAYEVHHSDAEWRALLGADRFAVMREGGTEPAGSSPLNAQTRAGVYRCYGCNLDLFSSKVKYDAGEGWPSFWAVLPGATRTKDDLTREVNLYTIKP